MPASRISSLSHFVALALLATACPAPPNSETDAGSLADAASDVEGVLTDANVFDGPRLDAAILDAAILDAAILDAAILDAATPDVSTLDAATQDARTLDAGEPDVEPTDAGETSGDFVVMTFNTGTTDGLAHNSDGDGYGDTQVEISDTYYGNGLAWVDAIDAATLFFAQEQPDIVAFQEIFHPDDCAQIPLEQSTGFVCASWREGDPTVAQTILGAGYQVACNLGKPDKCLGVKTSFAQIRGCSESLCLDGLDGAPLPNCGGGSRVGRATLDLVAGGELTVVTVHGTSGTSGDDVNCREAQIEQVFTNLDGEAGVNGTRNIVLGDFNVDPSLAFFDNSADRWTDYVDGNNTFRFLTDYGFDSDPTYGGVANIDHVASDTFLGTCVAHGITEGFPAVNANVYFDHVPLACVLRQP